MNLPYRRGDCPGLSAPMPTGDGLLVRLVPTEPVARDAFIGLCMAVRQHGNGIVEVSARGSLQVRGLTPCSAPLFATAVAAYAIGSQEGVPILTAPLLENADAPIAALAIAGELGQAIVRARLALSPKVSVVVDGDGRLHLDAVSSDIRLRAAAPEQSAPFHIGVAGDGTTASWLGIVLPGQTVEAVIALLTIVAARGPAARAKDVLRTEGVGVFQAALKPLIAGTSAPPPREPARMVGMHPLRDGTFAIGVGLAFGHAHVDALLQLADGAAAHGVYAVRPAPDRTLLLFGTRDPIGLAAAAETLGFVVRADDPRRRVAACPGSPACASGLIPARALAAALAPALARHFPATGISVHVSGCPKGCAHPRPAPLTLVGSAQGCGVVRDGSARAMPGEYVDPAALATEMSRLAAPLNEAVHG